MSPYESEIICCRPGLTALQIFALATPSSRLVGFAIVMIVLWGTLVPFAEIGTTLVFAVLAMSVFKLAITALGLLYFDWRVAIDGDSVSFLHGSHCVARCLINHEETQSIDAIETRWSPRHLQVRKTNGEAIHVLYGISKLDLTVVVARLQTILGRSRSN